MSLPGSTSTLQPTLYPVFLPRTERTLVIALLVVATAQALLWSLLRPLDDGGPDESAHAAIVFAIRNHGGWPTAAVPGTPPNFERIPNAFGFVVAALLAIVRSADESLTMHVARLPYVALLPLTLWLAYLTLRRIFSRRQGARVWGVAVLAAIPNFVLAHAIVTNDSPAIAVSTLAVYATIRASQENYRRSDVLLLGGALGLVLLHKFNGLLILPGAAGLVVWDLWRRPRRLLRVSGVLIGCIALVAGWTIFRAVAVYGHPLGGILAHAEPSAGAMSASEQMSFLEFLRTSDWVGEVFATFWAGYGLEKLKLPGAVHVGLAVFIGVAGIGLVWRAIQWIAQRPPSRPPIHLIVLAAFLFGGLVFMSLWRSYSVVLGLAGRYLYPSAVPFVILLIAGLGAFAWRRAPLSGVAVLTLPALPAASLAYTLHILVRDVIAYAY